MKASFSPQDAAAWLILGIVLGCLLIWRSRREDTGKGFAGEIPPSSTFEDAYTEHTEDAARG
jgi:hypothetical protein